MRIRGYVHKYGDKIDTDVIIPGVYLKEHDPKQLAKHAMEGIDPDFVRRVREGDVIVAGRSFGVGSSREHAVYALRYAGIRAILAKSFSRIFYRNCINTGLIVPIEIDDDVYRSLETGDLVELYVEEGRLRVESKGLELKINPPSRIVVEIIRRGGLLNIDPEELKRIASQ